MAKEYDVYRDSYFRYLGYSNEVGESFRPLIHVNLVRLSYGVAVSYCLADVYDKWNRALKKENNLYKAAYSAGDVLIWQMLASVAIPGFTINRITWLTGRILRQVNIKKNLKSILPTMCGLTSIPFIIKPIDHLVDSLLDNTYRKFI